MTERSDLQVVIILIQERLRLVQTVLLFQLQAIHAPPRVVIADFRQLRLKGIFSQVRVCTPTDDAVKAAFSLTRVQVGLVDV